MSEDSIRTAHQALAAGRIDAARQLLEGAADAGDDNALVELGFLHLSHRRGQEDIVAAHGCFARAAARGHGGAALIDVALTANGSSGTPDWAGAVERLRHAARHDELAAQHLQLLSAMALTADGQPVRMPRTEVLSDTPRIVRIPEFCTPIEAAHIVSIVMQDMRPATVFDPASGRQVAHPIRASDFAAIGPFQESLVAQAINRRIAAATGTHWSQGEPLSVLRYSVGQQYRLHMDTLPNEPNQRIRTAILYLNHGFLGGQTSFPALGVSVAARMGDLLIFDNVDDAGAPEPLCRHAGLPIQAGTKWIATRWIRSQPYNPWTDFRG